MSSLLPPDDINAPAPPTNVLPTSRCGVDVGAHVVAEMRGAYQKMTIAQRELYDISFADAASEHSARLELISLREELRLLRQTNARDQAVRAQFDRQCAPLLRGLELNLALIRKVYERARLGHQRGIDVLKSEFDYTAHYRHDKSAIRYDSKKLGWVKTDEAFKACAFVPKKHI